MDTRKVLLKFHLYLGLVSALFLIILGLTGSVIAFEGDIVHWAHPSLWYVKAGTQTLPESQLIQNVEQKFAPAHVRGLQMPRQANMAQVMTMSRMPGAAQSEDPRGVTKVFVNPYDGSIQGVQTHAYTTEKVLAFIHSLHIRLAWGEKGETIVSFAGLILLIEVPLGIYLWWRTRRLSVKWGESAHRLSFDLHNAIGVYAAVFLFLAALTGIGIGFDFVNPLIFKATHSEPLVQRRNPQSTVVEGGAPISVDKAMEVARQAMPDATVNEVQIPGNPKSTYVVAMRVPEEVTEAVHSTVVIDQYSGQVLRQQSFKESMGYRVIRFNRALHTGDILGMPTHILMSLSSLVLVLMVITGVIIWWKKQAI